jgi:class 3 adenylate cyclase
MAEDRVDRRLAAIFAGDIAGYSRLMGADEEGTLRQLKAHRKELVAPKITEHRGRIVKTTGDGILVEFVSVVDAVRCAVDIQRGMAERNADVPADKRIQFRIGINVGDIIIDGDDLFGDGVNVAARLESLADPGGILVSSVVHDHGETDDNVHRTRRIFLSQSRPRKARNRGRTSAEVQKRSTSKSHGVIASGFSNNACVSRRPATCLSTVPRSAKQGFGTDRSSVCHTMVSFNVSF